MMYIKNCYFEIKINTPKVKRFQVIYKLREKHDIWILCDILSVSISWYYKYKSLKESNNTKEDREKNIKNKIEIIYIKHKWYYWYRRITMELQRQWLTINDKKVKRIMRKYGLVWKIRKRNPYKDAMKKWLEDLTCKNLLSRDFNTWRPFEKVWTDITYLYYKWWKCYLSIAKDIISGEILAYKLNEHLYLNLSLDVAKVVLNKCGKWVMIHSDQWSHYTNPLYHKLLEDNWAIQSMSRKWVCIDNAPTETWFWHMKDELEHEISICNNYKEVVDLVEQYIIFYNNDRPQREKKKMTPVEYRNHLLKVEAFL